MLKISKSEYENLDYINNELEEDSNDSVVYDVKDEIDNDIFVDNSLEMSDIVSEKKEDGIVNTCENSNDIFLDDDIYEMETSNGIGIELDTKEVFGDSLVKEIKELTEIKINASDVSNMTIPTEIFIEDPPAEKEIDLFKVTDPFLDDNEFELNGENNSDEIKGNMPLIRNIGSVKPNNALSKIENIVKDNSDVILPNLGLVDDVKSDVPIVSENYIS